MLRLQVLLGVGCECKVRYAVNACCRCGTDCMFMYGQVKETGMQMVLIVAQHLSMGMGKTAAQCCHASLGLFKQMVSSHLPQLEAWEVRQACVPNACGTS